MPQYQIEMFNITILDLYLELFDKLYISIELEIRKILPYHFNYLCKNNVEASWSFLLYSHVYNINLERDSIKAYTRKCGYLGTGSRFAHSSRKYLLTLLIVMTGYVYTYHQCCAGLSKGVYTNFFYHISGVSKIELAQQLIMNKILYLDEQGPENGH